MPDTIVDLKTRLGIAKEQIEIDQRQKTIDRDLLAQFRKRSDAFRQILEEVRAEQRANWSQLTAAKIADDHHAQEIHGSRDILLTLFVTQINEAMED